MNFFLTQQYTIELFKCYRQWPCLWDKRHKDYYNNDIRNTAYKELLKLYQQVKPFATVDKLRKKLSYYKTIYFRELAKVEISRKVATKLEDVYIPSLWYYQALSFLSENCGDADIRLSTDTANAEPIELYDSDMSSDGEGQGLSNTNISAIEPMDMKQEIIEPQVEIFSPEENRAAASFNHSDSDILGKALIIQLRSIKEPQRTIADKLISDVIYYAKMGRLTDKTRVALELK